MTEKKPNEFVLERYRDLIGHSHPNHATIWPLISGHDCRIAQFKNWLVIIFTHTGNSGAVTSYGIGELAQALLDAGLLTKET